MKIHEDETLFKARFGDPSYSSRRAVRLDCFEDGVHRGFGSVSKIEVNGNHATFHFTNGSEFEMYVLFFGFKSAVGRLNGLHRHVEVN